MSHTTTAVDLEKSRRETLRWLILQTLNSARPIGASEVLILTALQAVLPDYTQREVRCELDYLESRELLAVTGRGMQPAWFAKLTRHGVDVVEYTCACEPGIARPQKYW